MKADLVDRIYECAVVPELWDNVLDELAQLSDSRGGLLFSARKALNWTASDSIRDVFADYVSDGWFAHCSRRVCLMSQSEPSFFVEHDFWSEDELDHNPIYRDFFRPRGLGWSAGTGLQVPSGDNIVFSVEREFDRGPIEKKHVDRLNELRPHLARSAFIAARLGLQRAGGANEALTAIGLPALVLGEDGTVIEANPLIEAMTGHVNWRSDNRISLADPRASEQLSASLASLTGSSAQSPQSFPLRDATGTADTVAHVVPIRGSAHDVFGGSYALLVLTPVTPARGPSIELIKSLFDLTPSEARVARALSAGETLEDIAEGAGVAITTVRSQLRKVLNKTGCARQAEVVALLASVTLGAGAQ